MMIPRNCSHETSRWDSVADVVSTFDISALLLAPPALVAPETSPPSDGLIPVKDTFCSAFSSLRENATWFWYAPHFRTLQENIIAKTSSSRTVCLFVIFFDVLSARRGKRKQVGTEGKKLPGFPACQYTTLHHFSVLSLHGCLHAFALRKNRDDDGDEDEEVTGAVSAACGEASHGGEETAGT